MEKENTVHSELELVEQLFRQYYKVLRAYAFRFVNDWGVAEDVVQDVFVALWSRRDQVDLEGAVKAYLFKSVYHKSLNNLTSKRYTEEESIERFMGQLDTMKVQESNQENSLFMKEIQAEIDSFVETLPGQVKKVFLLSRSHGLKNKEVAAQLNLSLKTVEKHLSKALLELRIYLNDKGLMSALLFLYLYSE